jgi:hypothetical protein
MTEPRLNGFRLGVYVFKDAEVVDFTAPYGVFSVARVVDSGRIVTAGGIASGMELGFHLLRRAGYSEHVLAEIARVTEYRRAYEFYREDIEIAPNQRRARSPGAIA